MLGRRDFLRHTVAGAVAMSMASRAHAQAAKIKPGGPNGLQIDDYADQPIKLVNISRSLS